MSIQTSDAALKGAQLPVIAPITLVYASTLTVNSSAVKIGRCALTGNVTIAPPTFPTDDGRLELWLTASGSARNLSFDPAIIIPSESSFTNLKTLDSGKTYIVLLKYDGTAGGGQWELASIVGGY